MQSTHILGATLAGCKMVGCGTGLDTLFFSHKMPKAALHVPREPHGRHEPLGNRVLPVLAVSQGLLDHLVHHHGQS